MKTLIACMCCAIIFISCSDRKGKLVYTGEILVSDEYEVSDSVLNDTYMFNFPRDIFVMDSLLIVHDSDGMEAAFHVFSKYTGEHVLDFGLRGRGPGETLNVSSVNLLGDTLYVYDANLRKVILYNIPEILAGKSSWKEINVSRDVPYMILQVVPIGNEKMILCGNNDKMRFGIWDTSSDEAEAKVCEYPPYSKDKEANSAISNYSASVKFNEFESKLVSATYIGATMEIYDVSSSGIVRTFSEYYYRPEYEYARGAVPRWVIPGEDSVIGFQDICLTDSGIYGLIWGVRSSAMEASVPELIKFAYNGMPMCRYLIPDILESVVVDENGDIYGMALNGNMESNIKKYVCTKRSES